MPNDIEDINNKHGKPVPGRVMWNLTQSKWTRPATKIQNYLCDIQWCSEKLSSFILNELAIALEFCVMKGRRTAPWRRREACR